MKIGHYFAGAGLLVLPFIISVEGEQMREPKARFLAVLFGLWLATELWRKVHPSLGCAAAVLFISAASTAMITPTFELLTLIAAFGSCLWIAHPRKNDVKRGLEVLEVSGILCSAYALVFQLQGEGYFITVAPGGLPMAAFGQQTLYGPFAVACFASALFHGRYFRAFLLVFPIFIISSSFTYLSLVVVLFLFGFSRVGKWAVLAAFVFCVTAFAGSKIWPSQSRELLDDKNRFNLWGQTIQIANRHWLLGHGFSSFRVIYPIFQDPELRKANGIDDTKQSPEMQAFFTKANELRTGSGIFLHPHSEPVSVYFEFGLLGLGIALWWVWAFVIRAFCAPIEAYYHAWIFKEERSTWEPLSPSSWALVAIFFSVIANSFGNFPFHLIPQALLPLWAFVAVTTQREDSTLEEDATH